MLQIEKSTLECTLVQVERQGATLQEARATVVAMVERERELPAGPLADDLRSERLALESSSEKLRLRIELFRSEKLVTGARYLGNQASSRSGETLAALNREAGELRSLIEHAKETLARLQTEPR